MASRRGLLKLGVAGTVLLAVGGGVAALWTPGLQAGRLTAAGRQSLGALARAVLDGTLAEDEAALARHLDAFEGVIANFPPAVREELQLLLSMTANAAGRLGLIGTTKSLQDLPRADLQALLQSMRLSNMAMRQQAYFALRDLNYAAHFADPAAWAAIGYPGPTVIA